MDTVKPALPEDLRVLDGTDEERPLATRELVNEQANDPYWIEFSNTVEKLGSVYSYDKNGIFIRQAQIDGSLQKVIPTSLRARILYLHTILSSLVIW